MRDFSPERAATALLLRQRLQSLAINVTNLRYDYPIRFDTMQSFCARTRMTLKEMRLYSPDGMTVGLMEGGRQTYYILYDGDATGTRRRNFTLAHEIGHIYLRHKEDGDRQEREADRFAAQLLMPWILVKQLAREYGGIVTPQDLCGVFAVSRLAAANRLRFLSRCPPMGEDDLALLQKCDRLLPDNSGPLLSW